MDGNRHTAISPDERTGSVTGPAYRALARETWRRRKGRIVRRPVQRLEIAVYTVAARPLLQNTSCTALIGCCNAAASSVPLPP